MIFDSNGSFLSYLDLLALCFSVWFLDIRNLHEIKQNNNGTVDVGESLV